MRKAGWLSFGVPGWLRSGLGSVAGGAGGRRIAPAVVALSLLASTGLPNVALAATGASVSGPVYDISFPECQSTFPNPVPDGQSIIGVNGGRSFTQNPCFGQEYRWGTSRGQTPAFYINVHSPEGSSAAQGDSGPLGQCAPYDQNCRSYNYGYNAAQSSDAFTQAQHASSTTWWLDVETMNYWSADKAANAQVIQGAADYLRNRGYVVGIYSIAPMWWTIAGGFQPGLPIWVAQTSQSVPILDYCLGRYAFGGGKAVLVQHWSGSRDVDYTCPGGSSSSPAPVVAVSAPPPPTNSVPAGVLAGSTGGASVSETFYYPGNNVQEAITVDFDTRGANTANAFFAMLSLNGVPVAHVPAANIATPGHLVLNLTAAQAGSATIQLTNYNPGASTPISYTIQHTPS